VETQLAQQAVQVEQEFCSLHSQFQLEQVLMVTTLVVEQVVLKHREELLVLEALVVEATAECGVIVQQMQ
jgi:hypothetical protein